MAGKPIHGFSGTKIYDVWLQMIQRCEKPNHRVYPLYGARGISVCARWHDIRNFVEDMGLPPAGMSLDRIDNNGGYCKENCRWTDQKTQMNNTRRNEYYEHAGKRLTVTQWAREIGIRADTMYYRLKNWGIARALSAPVHHAGERRIQK